MRPGLVTSLIRVRFGLLELVELNVPSSRVYFGRWEVSPDSDVVRTFETTLADGSTARYREMWRWRDTAHDTFDWYTETFEGGELLKGEVIVSWHRKH